MPDDAENRDSGLRQAALSKAADLGIDNTSFLKEALKWQYNWIGLAGAAGFALVSGSGLPLVLAAGLELIYLSVVPQSSRFRRLVRSWKYAEEKRKHDLAAQAMFRDLPDPVKNRYMGVARVCQLIRENYKKLSSSSQIFVSQMDEKLQGLLYGYVRLLHAAHQQDGFLQMSNPGSIQREIAQLKGSLDKEPVKVREINQKRIEILTKRLEKFEKIRENARVVDAQCSAIEDVLELIRDQSMTMRDPQELTYRIETLVQDVEQTESTVREMEALFEMSPDFSEAAPEMLSSPGQPGARNRTRN